LNYQLNSLPLVSVIITTYNRAELICKTIDSILSQTYKNFELIIIDDGSTDNTKEVIKMYSDSRLQYIKTDNWGGPARPRNIGIKKSSGQYIAFCDDDDIWLPEKLEEQVKAITNSKSKMIFSMQKQFGGTNIFSSYFGIGPLPFKVNTSANNLLKTNCIPLSSVMVEKLLLSEIGGFDERRSFIAIEDNDLWIRVSKKTNILFIDRVLVFHRVHKNSIYKNTKSIDQGKKELYRKYNYNDKEENSSKITNNKLYFLFRNIFLLIFERGQFILFKMKKYYNT